MYFLFIITLIYVYILLVYVVEISLDFVFSHCWSWRKKIKTARVRLLFLYRDLNHALFSNHKKVLASWCHLLTKANVYSICCLAKVHFCLVWLWEGVCVCVFVCVHTFCKWITGDRCVFSHNLPRISILASAKIQNCAGQKACGRARAQVINESLRFYLAHLGYTHTLQHSLHETLHTPLPVKGTVHSEKENWHHLLTLRSFQISKTFLSAWFDLSGRQTKKCSWLMLLIIIYSLCLYVIYCLVT